MNRFIKIALSIFIGAILIVAASYSFIWVSYKNQVENEVIWLTEQSKYEEFTINSNGVSTSNFPFYPVTKWSGSFDINEQNLKLFVPDLTLKGFMIGGSDFTLSLPKGVSVGPNDWESINIIDDLNLTITLPKKFIKDFKRDQAINWRNNGQKIIVKPSYIETDDFHVSGDGVFFLDNNLQIAGDMNLTIKNPHKLVELFQKGQSMDVITATIFNTLISTLLKKDEVTGEEYIKTKVTIENSDIYLGMLKISSMQKIIWE